MADINALLGIGIEDEENLRELADQLRGRKRAADFFAATTVPSIREAANREQKSVEGAAAQAGVLKRAMEDRKSRESTAGRYYGSGMPKYVRSYRAPDSAGGGRHVIGMTPQGPFNFTTGQLMESLDGYEPDPMTEGQSAAYMARMDVATKFQNRLVKAFERADKLLEKYTIGGKDPRPWGDIPGLGRYSGKSGAEGWVGRKAEEFLEGEGDVPDTVYSAMKDIRHILVQESAGLTQSINEMAAMKGISGDELLTNPEVFMRYYDEIKMRIHDELQRKYKAAPWGVKQEWDRAYGGDNDINPFKWTPNFLKFPEGGKDSLSDLYPNIDGGARLPFQNDWEEVD